MAERRGGLGPGLPFILFGLVVLYVGYFVVHKGKATHAWPSVPGTVIATSVATRLPEGGRKEGRRGVAYYPIWEYEYTVDGQRFKAIRVQEGEMTVYYGSRERAERQLASRLPLGSPVTVFYDPANPSSAFLVRGVSRQVMWIFVGGGSLIAVGLLIIVLVRRYAPSPSSEHR